MARLTPAEIVEKQKRRLQGAIPDITNGVNRVTVAPGILAAKNKAKWVAKMTDPGIQKKWADNTGAVTLEQWKADMINKGVGRIAQGIEGAKEKLMVFYEKLNVFQDSGKVKLDTMPNLTLEDSVSRASYWIRYMATFKK